MNRLLSRIYYNESASFGVKATRAIPSDGRNYFFCKFLIKSPLFLGLIILLMAQSLGQCQWKKVFSRPNIDPGNVPGWSILHYRNGIIWAGYSYTPLGFLFDGLPDYSEIWISEDTGRTWKMQSKLPLRVCTDIRFLNENVGLVCGSGTHLANGTISLAGEIYGTTDRGLSWKRLFGDLESISGGTVYSNGYLGSPSKLVASCDGGVLISTDAGNTWELLSISNPGYTLSIASSESSNNSCFINGQPHDGSVYSSSDAGITWTRNSNKIPVDTYTVAIDSCDSKTIYFANEDVALRENNLSNLLMTNDYGPSWASIFNALTYSLTGVVATSRHAIFCPTYSEGIIRSTDKGNTWVNIGGSVRGGAIPTIEIDYRPLTVICDDILLVGDLYGDIWLTTNGGGNPILLPNSLFVDDTITKCDSPIVYSIRLPVDGCNLLSDAIPKLTGSNNYSVTPISPDSLQITFSPTNLSDTSDGFLILIFSDGTNHTIRLVGTVAQGRNRLYCHTEDKFVDTIGQTVRIPLSIETFTGPRDMEIVMHYDKSADIIYGGSFSLTGAKLDMPGEQWPGRSKLRLNDAMSNALLAEASFTVFADSLERPKVWFDSLTVPSSTSPCEFSIPPMAVSTINPLANCGASTISKFMRTGRIPSITIYPNPTNATIHIQSSQQIAGCRLSIFDPLGKAFIETTVDLTKDVPKTIDVSTLSSGVYSVRLQGDGYATSQVLIIAK
jgi:photosystem II stability/assembly factor-like uncharacterized protein